MIEVAGSTCIEKCDLPPSGCMSRQILLREIWADVPDSAELRGVVDLVNSP